MKEVEKATAATKESSKELIEASRVAQLNCKSVKYDVHLKAIAAHAADKAAWEAAEADRAVAAKKLADDQAKLLSATPKLGEKNYDCHKMLSGKRPTCKSGLC